MIDLQKGDNVLFDIDDGITRIGTVDKIQPADNDNHLFVILVVCEGLLPATMLFYEDELIKTYNNHDLDSRVKALTAL